ncbi:MAG: hypothetical protein K0R13_2337 [Propionibacteriaceae bacterium]|jgi:hypothetical protein|nr:hypothetical protein [Propionibacteriaceae bacterium]
MAPRGTTVLGVLDKKGRRESAQVHVSNAHRPAREVSAADWSAPQATIRGRRAST